MDKGEGKGVGGKNVKESKRRRRSSNGPFQFYDAIHISKRKWYLGNRPIDTSHDVTRMLPTFIKIGLFYYSSFLTYN